MSAFGFQIFQKIEFDQQFLDRFRSLKTKYQYFREQGVDYAQTNLQEDIFILVLI